MNFKKWITLPMALAVVGGIVLTIYKPDIQVKVASMLGKYPDQGGQG